MQQVGAKGFAQAQPVFELPRAVTTPKLPPLVLPERAAQTPMRRAVIAVSHAWVLHRRIFVRGDRAISYGRVMEVMGVVSSAGFSRVASATSLIGLLRLRR